MPKIDRITLFGTPVNCAPFLRAVEAHEAFEAGRAARKPWRVMQDLERRRDVDYRALTAEEKLVFLQWRYALEPDRAVMKALLSDTSY